MAAISSGGRASARQQAQRAHARQLAQSARAEQAWSPGAASYPGPYEAEPRAEAVALPCAGMRMAGDVTVLGIPRRDVRNGHGTTVTIG